MTSNSPLAIYCLSCYCFSSAAVTAHSDPFHFSYSDYRTLAKSIRNVPISFEYSKMISAIAEEVGVELNNEITFLYSAGPSPPASPRQMKKRGETFMNN